MAPFGEVICLTIFLGNSFRKSDFQILNQVAHLNHQTFTIIYCMPHFFGCFIPKLGDLDSRLGGCGTRVMSDLFFKCFGRQGQKTQD
jgi:hypothetical protein